MDIFLADLGKLMLWAISVAATAWGAFKFLPERWLQHRFDRQLEQQRNEHAQQMAETRHRFDVLAKRLSKLHEKEFDVLADIWEKLNEALGHVGGLVSAMQSYPDLDRMDEPRFKSVVEASVFDPVDKAELLGKQSRDRNKFYQDRIFWYRLRDARVACRELHRAIQRNSIFLEPKVRDLFLKIDALVFRTLTSREIGEEAGDRMLWREAGERLTNEVMPLKDEIESDVQKRLGRESGP